MLEGRFSNIGSLRNGFCFIFDSHDKFDRREGPQYQPIVPLHEGDTGTTTNRNHKGKLLVGQSPRLSESAKSVEG